MRQILLSVVFVLSGVAQINAHHTDRENFGALYTKHDTIDRFFNDNRPEFLKGCEIEPIVQLLRNILNGVPSDVSLALFSQGYTGTNFSTKIAHALIYAQFLNTLHLSPRNLSKAAQDSYKSLGDATDSSGNPIYMTSSEKHIIGTTFYACGLLGL
jgi:hypothetical protein